MKIDCTLITTLDLLRCNEIETVDNAKGICISTPFRWRDGSVLSFYIIPYNNKIMITDDANTTFHLHTQGLAVNKATYNALRARIEGIDANIAIDEDGEIFCLGDEKDLPYLVADYIKAMNAVMRYEMEALGVPEEMNTLAEEVEHYLRLLKPNANVIKKPILQGISGHEYKFDFEIDNQIFLAISPNPTAVGAVMRKVGDVVSGSELADREIVVVVDDRATDDLFYNQKASEEIRIISSLAKAVPLTNLIPKTETTSNRPH